MTSAAPSKPEIIDRPDQNEVAEPQLPWVVVVWNDPVNLMSYVTYVFQKLFGYSREKATRLMLDVHQKGRAVVSRGPSSTSSGFTSTGCGPRWNMTPRRLARRADGHFDVDLPPEERSLLRSLPSSMRLAPPEGTPADAPALPRLNPKAYPDDDDSESEYRDLIGNELDA